MLKLGRHVLLAAFLLHTVALADTPSIETTHAAALPSAAHPSISSPPSVSTCKSRAINYITHTLPQQCLKSRPTTSSPPPSGPDSTASPDSGAATPTSAPANTDGAGHTSADSAPGPKASSERQSSSRPPNEARAGSVPASQSAAGPAQPSAGAGQGGGGSRMPSPDAEAEAEGDSPLDNAHFLSFEEWKKRNLAKAGQSPENVGQGRGTAAGQGRKPRPVNINNELDFLGEDTEIELDFGFGRAGQGATVSPAGDGSDAVTSGAAKEVPANHRPRSKDAGKTCKERFNYASFDCAATVLKTNSQCKSSSSVLVENKDSYMLNECGAENKFVIVELCDDILVDTIVLANFEFFSSMFRTFRVGVSDRYPVKLERWKELGTFEARNSRDLQAFLVENPLIWARYLRIEFLSHYGNEFYCPVSLLRVHGTTMMEEFRHQEEAARGDEDLDEVIESESQAAPAIQQARPRDDVHAGVPEDGSNKASAAVAHSEVTPGNPGDSTKSDPANQSGDAVSAADNRPTTKRSATSTDAGVAEGSTDQIDSRPASTVTPEVGPESIVTQHGNSSGLPHDQTGVERHTHANSSTTSTSPETGSAQGKSPSEPGTNGTVSTAAGSPSTADQKSTSSPGEGGSGTTNGTASRTSGSSASQPPNAVPTTQESFFKSIHKRLQMLESNSTLSLQYIEDQSRILRDAFSKVEKRQLGKTEKFLDHLNSTVMAELREFRQQYDQLWQSTVIELENRREQHQREMMAISTRLTLVADELVFQKRMAVVQSTLILLCLGLVLFVRSGSSYLELPLVQQMMHKSQSALRLPFDSPSGSPPPGRYRRHAHSSSTEERKRSRFFGSSSGNLSDGSTDGPRSPMLEFSPPTPTSDGDGETGSRSGSRERSRKTQSSPATPRGFRDGSRLRWGGSAAEVRLLGGGDGQKPSGRRGAPRRGEEVGSGGGDRNQAGDWGGSGAEWTG